MITLGMKSNKPLAKQCSGIIIMMLGLISCSAPLSSDEVQAREELLSLAPVGSDVRLAKPLLKKQGFECSWTTQETFGDSEDKHDYLYCDIQKRVGIFVTRRWQVALIHQNNLVEDAAIGIGLIGL